MDEQIVENVLDSMDTERILSECAWAYSDLAILRIVQPHCAGRMMNPRRPSQALQRTRQEHRGRPRCVSCAGSLRLGR